jgi:hypothetical protein
VISFLKELRNRNALLYWFGWYNLIAGIVCIGLMIFDDVQILGISRWIKPMKFFLSVAVMVWTMGWLMYYLDAKRSVRRCSRVIVLAMFIENFVITLQSARGTTSHFNETSALNGILFGIMGMFIVVFTVAVIYITWLFFRQKQFHISASYLWGIRLGLLLFLIFSIEGGMMVQQSAHTIGAPDGSPGLPIVNWSKAYGDLRIAHFLGMHALQLLPLAGYFIFRKKQSIILFGIIYFLLVSAMFILAIQGKPLIAA